MKALNMSYASDIKRVRERNPQPLTGGICRKPLSPERLQELNMLKRQQLKAEREAREWERFCKKLVSEKTSLTELVKTVRKSHPSNKS